MNDNLYVVDAFTDRAYAGNPAAVCLLESPESDAWMQCVAREMNLSETAFLLPIDGGYSLRWFTPLAEVDLCGHATLAAAHCLWETGALDRHRTAKFSTRSSWLTCRVDGEWIEMDFPAIATVAADPPAPLLEGLAVDPVFTGNAGGINWVVEVDSEQIVASLRPQFDKLLQLPVQGFIVTARSQSGKFDFVSRYFAPSVGVDEDPVTGSAHCALGPYWQSKIGKADFLAYQASKRGGVVRVGVRGNRVLLGGQAVTVSRLTLVQAPKF